MSEPNKYREWILETIDSLRSRKARPDLERICRMVRRRHGSDPERTRTELEKLIQEQTVLKVSYKGSISYRNAAKVQRKSRKKSEFAAKPHPQNNGDSAHSFTDQEEGEELQSGPGQQTSAAGATTSCGWKEEKASAATDGGLGQQGGEEGGNRGESSSSSPPSASDRKPSANNANSGSTAATSGGKQQTSPSSFHALHLKPKLQVPTGGSARTAGDHGNCDLGDRLLDCVRSLSGDSAGRMMKPLALKEIWNHLSGQEEKLSRGKVRAVMEREVARGRLRRTRCGNVALPESDNLSADALQDKVRLEKPTLPALRSDEPVEAALEEQKQGENEVAEQPDDLQTSDEEERLLPLAATNEQGTENAEIQRDSVDESFPEEKESVKGISQPDVPKSEDQLAEEISSVHHNGAHVDVGAVSPVQLHMESQSQSLPPNEEINHISTDFNNLEYKTEAGVSSCMLTPTASPRDSGLSEEPGFSSEGILKCEGTSGSPVDWTVSDVVSYFTAAGFPEQAAAFRIQEIDGKSLLLMQRNDVLTGLSIRLGPALKIYERHVKVLQKTHFEDDDC